MQYKSRDMKSSNEHKISNLLSKEENEQIFKLFGVKCQSLATAVVQLYVTQSPDHTKWLKKDTGVLCFIKDHMKRNYFFRLYCPTRRIVIWEQELYINLDYTSPYPFFHMFEANDYIAGVNFASEDEASVMQTVVLEKLEMKRQRREERRQRNAQIQGNHQGSQDSYKPPLQSSVSLTHDASYGQPNIAQSFGHAHNKSKKRRHLTKADIGLPSDFKHISHVGWDPNKGFDVNVDDPQLREFFNKAGVSDRQLRDKDTREFIYDFIKTHGGLDAIKSEVVDTSAVASALQKRSPYLPPRGASEGGAPLPPLPAPAGANPPPVPARTPINRSAPPPPPGKARPPPPVSRGQPPPRPDTQPVPPSPAPPPISNIPLPPPPPPMVDVPMPPPPPPMNDVSSMAPPRPPTAGPRGDASNSMARHAESAPDPRSALLESIRQGRNLKPVEPVEKKPVVEDSRNNLLSAIRQGIELKPVQNIPKPAPIPSAPSNGLAAALSQALKSRALAIHSDSGSDSGNSSDDDDDWDNV